MDKPASAKQIVQLQDAFGRVLRNISDFCSEATSLNENFHLVNAIANGGLCDALVTKMRCEVAIDFTRSIKDRYQEVGFEPKPHDLTSFSFFSAGEYERRKWGEKKAILEVVSFTRSSYDVGDCISRLRRYGLEPATVDHVIAFAMANPPDTWPYPGILIYAPGSVGVLYKEPIGPMLFAPDGDKRKFWNFDHFGRSGISKDHPFSIRYEQWFLGVRIN